VCPLKWTAPYRPKGRRSYPLDSGSPKSRTITFIHVTPPTRFGWPCTIFRENCAWNGNCLHDLRNGTIFEGGEGEVTEHKLCVLIFSTNFVWNISRSKKKRVSYDKKMCIGLNVKCRVFLLETRIFTTDFSRNIQMLKFHKNPSSGTELFRAYGQTDSYWRG